jgi:antitoxin (DNA-binding transcriptional repressor) of toxin-antitoxin stability system
MKRGERVIGVRELKSGLSAYLRSVAKGATVTVGDRKKRPMVRLVPAVQSAEGEHLDRLAAKGVVRRGLGRPGLHPLVKPARRGSVSALVIEDRR